MYVITVPNQGNFQTNNTATFNMMRAFLLDQEMEFKAFYESGAECPVREEPSDVNRTYKSVDYIRLHQLSSALGMHEEMIKFLLEHASEYKGRVVTR